MLRVKGSDTLCPLGPGLVTDWDFHDKRIRTLVNGEVRQDGNTAEMEWDMHYLVADIARTITLVPGDVLLSGTPANSRPVEPGDVVTVEVEGLGALTNRIVSGPTESAPTSAPNPASPRRSARPRSAATGSTGGSGRRVAPAPSTTSRPWTPRGRAVTASSPTVDVAGVPVSPDHLIGGCRVPSPTTFEDRSPLDWSWKLADVARGDASTAHAAVTAAVMAFRDWADLGPAGRAEHLHRLADLIDAHNDEIAIVETVDMGMLHESMRLRLVARGALNFRTYADLAVTYEERHWSSKGTVNTVVRMPAGPAVVITPWNAPFMLSTWKLAPALAAGNTVVLKPAEWSPLSCSLLADLTVEAGFPPGVFNLVQGIGEEVGPPLVGDPRVKRISFTGSPETARHIGRAAAENIVPFTAELGGKGPLIVFADADLDAAAVKAAGQYDDSGQVCLAGTRLLVEASVRDEFLERFHAAVDAHVLGDSRDPATTIAPMIHPDHVARVEGFIERAREHGDHVVRGGHRSATRCTSSRR